MQKLFEEINDKTLMNKWEGLLDLYTRTKNGEAKENLDAIVIAATRIYEEIVARDLKVDPSPYTGHKKTLYKTIHDNVAAKNPTETYEEFIPRPILHQAGKSALAGQLIKMFPHHKKYVEGFMGSAAVYWRKKPSDSEVINDLAELWPFVFSTIKNLSDDDIKKLEKMDWTVSKKQFFKLRGIKKEGKHENMEKLEKLHLLIYLSKGSFFRNWTSYDHTIDGKDIKTYFTEWRERLQNTSIMQADYRKVIKEHDSPDTFFFLDPPYYQKGEGGKKVDGRDVGDCGDGIDMDELARLCANMKGKAMITLPRDANILKTFTKHGLIVKGIAAKQRFAHKRGGGQTKATYKWPVILNYEPKENEEYFIGDFEIIDFVDDTLPGSPYKFANSETTALENGMFDLTHSVNHLPEGEVFVEQNFSGQRVQVHKMGDVIRIFSSDGEADYPKIKEEVAKASNENLVLEGFVEGWTGGEYRKGDHEQVPSKGNAFLNVTDVVFFDTVIEDKRFSSLVADKDFASRRVMLEHFFSRGEHDRLQLSDIKRVSTKPDLAEAMSFYSREPGSLGAIVKSPTAQYQFGGSCDWYEYRDEADMDVEVLEKGEGMYRCAIYDKYERPVQVGLVKTETELEKGDIIKVAFSRMDKVEDKYAWRNSRFLFKQDSVVPYTTMNAEAIVARKGEKFINLSTEFDWIPVHQSKEEKEVRHGSADLYPEGVDDEGKDGWENELEEEDHKPLTSKRRSELPDSAFCYLKKQDGRTVRKFPAHDASHVRNALARLPSSNLSDEEKRKVHACLKMKAEKYGIKVSDYEGYYVLHKDAPVPPAGESGLPGNVMEVLPQQFHYWKMESENKRRFLRDRLLAALDTPDPVLNRFKEVVMGLSPAKLDMETKFSYVKQTFDDKSIFHLFLEEPGKSDIHFIFSSNPLSGDNLPVIRSDAHSDTLSEGSVPPKSVWNPTESNSKAVFFVKDGRAHVKEVDGGLRVRLYHENFHGDISFIQTQDGWTMAKQFGEFEARAYLHVEDYKLKSGESRNNWLEVEGILFVPGIHKGNLYEEKDLRNMTLQPKKGNKLAYVNFYHGQNESYRTGILKDTWWDPDQEWTCLEDGKVRKGANKFKAIITDQRAIKAIENGDILQVSAELGFDRVKGSQPKCVNIRCNGMAITDDPAVKQAWMQKVCNESGCSIVKIEE